MVTAWIRIVTLNLCVLHILQIHFLIEKEKSTCLFPIDPLLVSGIMLFLYNYRFVTYLLTYYCTMPKFYYFYFLLKFVKMIL